MFSVFKCLCIFQLSLLLANGIRIKNLIQSKHNLVFGEPIALQRENIRTVGTFENFLKSLFDLLIHGFPERKVLRYCRVLNRNLRDKEFKYTKELARHLRYLSRMYRADIKVEIEDYRKKLDEPPPMRNEFLKAMNDMFTLRENILFNDYLFDLRDYGNEDKLNIDEETKNLVNMVIESVFKLSRDDRNELERKLKKAVAEFRRE